MQQIESFQLSPEVVAAVEHWAGADFQKKKSEITSETLLSEVLPVIGRNVACSRMIAQLAKARGTKAPNPEKFFESKKTVGDIQRWYEKI